MRHHRPLVLFCLLLPLALHGNMRAPVQVTRGASALRAAGDSVKVLSESLEFHCPAAYTGKIDFKLFQNRNCAAKITYRIQATAQTVKLAFVFAGGNEVTWSHAGKVMASMARPMQEAEKLVCTFCPDEMRGLRVAEQILDLQSGENEIRVEYRQALDYSEQGHSYFSNGKWTQGFSYELWPLAEWQWAENLSVDLVFSIAARPGVLGMGYKADRMQCSVETNGSHTELAQSPATVTADRRRTRLRVALEKKPQRLRCWYSEG